MKNSLILNSKSNLLKNKNVFFLGHWCLQNTKGSFKNLSKYKVLNFKKSDSQIEKDIKITQKIYFNLLTDLTKKLNKFHKRKFSKRYWDIVIGPWLKVFIEIVYERFTSLENAIEKKKINHIVLAKYKNLNFFTDNVLDLVNKDIKSQDNWNFILYTKIFKFLEKKIKRDFVKIPNAPKNNRNVSNKKKDIRLIFVDLLSNLLRPFWKKKDFVIFESDMSIFDTIKIYLRLGQLPKINSEPSYAIKSKNIELRKKLFFKKNKVNKIEKFIRSVLPDVLPTDIIENYEKLDKLSNNLGLPNSPSFVFTSYGYQGKEVFKMWLGKKVEKKTKYFLCQHGSAHITSRNTIIESGFKNCDKFFSWGRNKNKKCVTLFNTKDVNTNINFDGNREKIYFFTPKMYPKRARLYNDYEKMIRENLEMEKILSGLNKKIQSKVVIKTYPALSFQKKFVNKILNEITFKNRRYELDSRYGAENKKLIYKKSKIIIHSSGDGTGILETLSADIPCVFIMENLNWIRNSCRRDYKSLVNAKILFFDYKKLTNHINKYYSRVEDWWESKEVTKAKKNFRNKYCKPAPKNYLKQLGNCLTENAK